LFCVSPVTLLSHGADINIQDAHGNTPLHLALQKCPHLVDVLLSYHPLIDIRNNLQGTPLHAALENSDSKNAKEFIERGADVNAINSNGNTPVLIAANSCPEVIYDLVKKNALLDKPNAQGITSLHVLLKKKNIHLAQSFINAGVNVNAQDENGISPLMIAAQNDLSEIFILLLQKGADHTLKDVHGQDCTSRLGGWWGNSDVRGEYEGYIYYHFKNN